MQLYNKLSSKEREELIEQAGEERFTLSFYTYHHLKNPKEFRDYLFINWNRLDVLGRINIAKEGINAQLSVPAKKFDQFKHFLDGINFLKDVRLNIAIEHYDKSFLKLKIKVRPKIVADGLNDLTFDVTNKGIHVDAKKFNELIEDPNTVLVDMRNHYESEIGHFKNAITPDVDTFRQSLDIIEEDLKDHKEDKNLVMYCTGGIRCEKASAYYKHKGFKKVYQLEGGIIEYARQVKDKNLDNKFFGKNFVFDDRRSEKISDDVISKCHQCGKTCDIHVNCANDGCHLLFIQCEECAKKMYSCCSNQCQDIIQLSYEEQKKLRSGRPAGNKKFKKGRSPVLKFK
jgi:UPF0176 protein